MKDLPGSKTFFSRRRDAESSESSFDSRRSRTRSLSSFWSNVFRAASVRNNSSESGVVSKLVPHRNWNRIRMRTRPTGRRYNRIFPVGPIALANAASIREAKIAIVLMIASFSPQHWHSKRQFGSFLVRPACQHGGTGDAHYIRTPRFFLEQSSKIRSLQLSDSFVACPHVALSAKLAANVAKIVH